MVRRHPVWDGAGDAAIRHLSTGWRLLDVPAHEVIVAKGEPSTEVHILVEGACRIFYPGDEPGLETTIKLARAPSVFGDVAVMMRVPYTASVASVIESRSVAVDGRIYLQALQLDTRACFRQYFDLASRFFGAIQMEETALTGTLTDRIAAILLAYAAQFGRDDEDGLLIDARLSQDDLARLTGSTRRSVSRALAELYGTKSVIRRGHRFVITDTAALLTALERPVPDIVGQTPAAPWTERRRKD